MQTMQGYYLNANSSYESLETRALSRCERWVGAQSLLQSGICIGIGTRAGGVGTRTRGWCHRRSSHLSLSLSTRALATKAWQAADQVTQVIGEAMALVAENARELRETAQKGLELSCDGCCACAGTTQHITHLGSDPVGEIGNRRSLGAIENVQHLGELLPKCFGDDAFLGDELGGGLVFGGEGGGGPGVDNSRLDAVDLLGLVDCRGKRKNEAKSVGENNFIRCQKIRQINLIC